MADKDLVEKKLEDHNDVFADILNTLLFGKRVQQAECLRNGPALDYPAEIAELLAIFLEDKRYRDVVPTVNAAKQKGERVTMCWMLQELIDKGEQRGEERGEERLAALLHRLMADGRSEAVQEAIGSEQARREYYREYGLID